MSIASAGPSRPKWPSCHFSIQHARKNCYKNFITGTEEMISMNNHRYDAIVIGAGHNGLVNAAYLAKAGKRVLVLERRHVVGGATVTEEIYPGFKYSVCSYVVSLLRPEVIRDLELPKYDLE